MRTGPAPVRIHGSYVLAGVALLPAIAPPAAVSLAPAVATLGLGQLGLLLFGQDLAERIGGRPLQIALLAPQVALRIVLAPTAALTPTAPLEPGPHVGDVELHLGVFLGGRELV